MSLIKENDIILLANSYTVLHSTHRIQKTEPKFTKNFIKRTGYVVNPSISGKPKTKTVEDTSIKVLIK